MAEERLLKAAAPGRFLVPLYLDQIGFVISAVSQANVGKMSPAEKSAHEKLLTQLNECKKQADRSAQGTGE